MHLLCVDVFMCTKAIGPNANNVSSVCVRARVCVRVYVCVCEVT